VVETAEYTARRSCGRATENAERENNGSWPVVMLRMLDLNAKMLL